MKKLILILLLLPVFLSGQVTIIRKALPTTVFGSPIPFGSFILIESTNLVYSVKKLSGLKADSALVNYILNSDYQIINRTDIAITGIDATNVSSVGYYNNGTLLFKESFGHSHLEYALQTQLNPINDTLDSLRVDLNNISIGQTVDTARIYDSLAVHLDTLQQHRIDINSITTGVAIPLSQVAYGNATSDGLTSNSGFNWTTDLLSVTGRINLNDAGNSVFIGYQAGNSDDKSNNRNVGIGYQSLHSNPTGYWNAATGAYSLYSNSTGFYNTANGYLSLYFNTTGHNNTAIGSESLFFNTTGFYNVGVGIETLFSNTTGTFNTASGIESSYHNTTGTYNTSNGCEALFYNSTGNSNTAEGAQSLFANITGSYNTASGFQSGRFNAVGDTNTASWNSLYLGANTKSLTATDTNAIVIGSDAISNGSRTATIGDTTLTDVYFGGDGRANIHINGLYDSSGDQGTSGQVLSSTATGTDWTAAGAGTVTEVTSATTGQLTVANGTTTPALTIVTGSIANGAQNLVISDVIFDALTVIGDTLAKHLDTLQRHRIDINAISSIVAANIWSKTGNYMYQSVLADSVGVGINTPISPLHIAGIVTQTGIGGSNYFGYNTGIVDDLSSNYNSGFGYQVLKANTTGYSNAGFGSSSLTATTSGYSNAGFGSLSLQLNTIGYQNSGVGTEVLFSNTEGYGLSALGFGAGKYYGAGTGANQTSNLSVYVGYDTRASADGNTNEIVIGANTIGNGSNTGTIGDDNLTDLYAGEAGQATIHAANVDQYVKVTLSAAQFNTLGTRFTLIAAPGAGKVIEITAVSVFLDLGLQAEVGTQRLIFGINTGSEMYGIDNTELETAADLVVQLSQKNNATIIANQSFGCVLSSATNPTAGSVTMNVYISYKILTL